MVIRAFALMLFLASVGLWAGLGGTLGWTKTKVPVEHTDPVTEIAYVTWETQFVPGIEFLALGAGGAIHRALNHAMKIRSIRRGENFELIGRDPTALPRGCSRTADEMLERSK